MSRPELEQIAGLGSQPRPIKSALVTGASGFVGQSLVSKLRSHGVCVTGLMRRHAVGKWERELLIDLACRGPTPQMLSGIDTVFHLAGKAHAIGQRSGSDAEHFETNLEGTRRLIEAAAGAGVQRFVFVSTVKAMRNDPAKCQDELSSGMPDSPYGRSKLAAEDLVLNGRQSSGMHCVVLRLPLVYGAGVKGNLDAMLRAVANGRFPPIGVSDNKRSLIGVEDVARIAISVAMAPKANGEIYILTDGAPYSTRELYELMCDALGRSRPKWHVPVAVLRIAAGFGDLYEMACNRPSKINTARLNTLLQSAWYSSDKIRNQLGLTTRCRVEHELPAMVRRLGS